MKPKQAADRLRTIAKTAREEGALPLQDLASFVHDLDPKRQAADAGSTVFALEKLAEHLESGTAQPVSRIQLATLLSRLAMESEFETALHLASKPKLTSELLQLGNVEEVKKKFKAENPDISDSELDEIAEQWKKNKDVVKDKSAADADPVVVELFENIKKTGIVAHRAASGARWRPAMVALMEIVDNIATILVRFGSMDTLKSEALKREIRQTIPGAAKALAEAPETVVMASAWKVNADASEDAKRSRFEQGKPADPTENMSPEDAQQWKVEHKKNKDNFKAAKRETHLEGKKGHTLCGEKTYSDTLVDSVKDATCHYCKQSWKKDHGGITAAEEKQTKFEEGKPADPTEQMSPEDAKKWKLEHLKNKDNFKSAEAWKA